MIGGTNEEEEAAWAAQPVWEESERPPMRRKLLQYHLALAPSDCFVRQ